MAQQRRRNGPYDSPSMKLVTVRLLFLLQLVTTLMVEINGLAANDYSLRNGNAIIKTNHIQNLDSQANAAGELKETLSGMHQIENLDDLTSIRRAADSNDAMNRNGNVGKIGHYDKNEATPCHMDIEYKMTKRVMGQCTNLGRTARGCIAGNYLQMFNTECF